MERPIKRRTLATSAAWAVPAVVVASRTPAFAASGKADEDRCVNTTVPSKWGYTISSEEYLCRGFNSKGNSFIDSIDNTDSMYFPFTISVKKGNGYGIMPAGTRFLFTVAFSKEAYNGQNKNVKGVSISKDSAYTVVGDNGFSNRSTTIAIDTVRDLQPGDSFTAWVRVLSGNKINEPNEAVVVTGELEKPGSKFWSGSDGEGCRTDIIAAFDGNYASADQKLANESDKKSESTKSCKKYDNHTWVATRTVTTRG